MSTVKPAAGGGKSAAQRLEELKARHKTLSDRRARVQFELEAAARQLAEAQQEAQQAYGISDLAGLRALYAERERSNEQLVEMFSFALEKVELGLEAVERQLAS